MVDKKVPKKFQKFQCIHCDYTTSRESQWKRHINTQKHKRFTNVDMANSIMYKCECGREYKQRQGLYRHKLKCKIITTEKDYFRLNSKKLNEIKFIKSELNLVDEDKLIKNIV